MKSIPAPKLIFALLATFAIAATACDTEQTLGVPEDGITALTPAERVVAPTTDNTPTSGDTILPPQSVTTADTTTTDTPQTTDGDVDMDPMPTGDMTHHDPAPGAQSGHATGATNLVSDATATSAKSGQWHDSDTWAGGNVPAQGARVRIAEGHTIEISQKLAPVYTSVHVLGSLQFKSSADSELKVDTLVVDTTGQLRMGQSKANPVAADKRARIIITDTNGGFEVTDTSSPDYDPSRTGQGLISLGRVSVYGAPKTAYGTTSGVTAGATVINLDQAPQGWRVGDKLVIAGTNDNANGDEVATISSINASTGAVTLQSPLTKDHKTPAHSHPSVKLKVHVANVTRNASIETAAGNENDLQKRGHVMFVHTNNVEVYNLALVNLGRTNKMAHMSAENRKARYAFHFHQAGSSGAPAHVEGSVVYDSPGWGFVNHSSNVNFVDNVAYDVNGAAFVTENGDEDGSFTRNLSIRTHGAANVSHQAKKHQFGHRGDGFWLVGPAVKLEGNIVSGSTGHAYGIWGATNNSTSGMAEGKHKFAAAIYDDPSVYGNASTMVRIEDMYFEQFKNNEAYGNSDHALMIASHSPSDRGARTVIEGFLAWNTAQPQMGHYMAGVTFKDSVFIRGDATNSGTAMSHGHTRPHQLRIENAYIEGFSTGIQVSDRSNNVISGGYIDSTTGVSVVAVKTGSGGVTISGMPTFGPGTATKIQGAHQ